MNFDELQKENIELKLKFENIKEYKKKYFQNVYKNKTYHCITCDKVIKCNSICYHNKSNKHKEKLELKLLDIELDKMENDKNLKIVNNDINLNNVDLN
jgi:hypothetical protein